MQCAVRAADGPTTDPAAASPARRESAAAAATRWPAATRVLDRYAHVGDHALSAGDRSTGSAMRLCRPPLRPIPTAMRRPVRSASAPLPPPVGQPGGQPRAWRMSVTSVVCKEGVGRQGLQPCTCYVPEQQPKQKQKQKQKRISCGMAGWVRLRAALQVPLRGPAQPPAAVRSGACEAVLRKQSALTHVSSVAACSCAQSCAHGKTGVGRPAQPARGMPRAHAAHAPQPPPPPPPSTVFCDLSEPAADGGCRPLVGTGSEPILNTAI